MRWIKCILKKWFREREQPSLTVQSLQTWLFGHSSFQMIISQEERNCTGVPYERVRVSEQRTVPDFSRKLQYDPFRSHEKQRVEHETGVNWSGRIHTGDPFWIWAPVERPGPNQRIPGIHRTLQNPVWGSPQAAKNRAPVESDRFRTGDTDAEQNVGRSDWECTWAHQTAQTTGAADFRDGSGIYNTDRWWKASKHKA